MIACTLEYVCGINWQEWSFKPMIITQRMLLPIDPKCVYNNNIHCMRYHYPFKDGMGNFPWKRTQT